MEEEQTRYYQEDDWWVCGVKMSTIRKLKPEEYSEARKEARGEIPCLL